MSNSIAWFVRAAARLALALPLGWASAALAQSGRPAPQTAVVELADRPLVSEPLGLRMMLPLDATAESFEIGSTTAIRIQLPGSRSVINIQKARSASDQPLTTVLDSIIRQRLSLTDTDPLPRIGFRTRTGSGQILERDDALQVGGLPSVRAYLQVKSAVGPDSVLGYTIFQPKPREFVTFELVSTVERQARDRGMYATSVGTVEFEDPLEASLTRAEGVRLGQGVLGQLTPADYEQVIGKLGSEWRWERLFSPSVTGADSGASEVGYRRVSASIGRRGDLDRRATSRSGADLQRGYVVHIESRTLHGEYIIDSAGAFFMTPDGEEEAWNIRMAVRDRKTGEVQNSREVGARSGTSMTVSTTVGDGPPEVIKPMVSGDGYICRAASSLLPHLLIHANAPGSYRFYAYQSRAGQIQMRSDVLEHPAGTNAWKLSTQLSADDATQVSYFGDDGEFLRTELPDGRIWEPITLPQLVSLWKSKGLPMD